MNSYKTFTEVIALTYQSFSRIVWKWYCRDGHVNRTYKEVWIVNVEKIFQVIILKPDSEAIFIIKNKGIIQSVNFTRKSVIDVWYEVIRTEIKVNFPIRCWKVKIDLIISISPPNFPFLICWNTSSCL